MTATKHHLYAAWRAAFPADLGARAIESAVVDVPHPDFGEVGVVVVVAGSGAKRDAAQLLAGLKQKLANVKIPKRCFVVPDLPRNTMGKVQKNRLREQFKNLFD